jgi:hypothetical protein
VRRNEQPVAWRSNPVAQPGNLMLHPGQQAWRAVASLSHYRKAEWAVDHLEPAWDDRIEVMYIST